MQLTIGGGLTSNGRGCLYTELKGQYCDILCYIFDNILT